MGYPERLPASANANLLRCFVFAESLCHLQTAPSRATPQQPHLKEHFSGSHKQSIQHKCQPFAHTARASTAENSNLTWLPLSPSLPPHLIYLFQVSPIPCFSPSLSYILAGCRSISVGCEGWVSLVLHSLRKWQLKSFLLNRLHSLKPTHEENLPEHLDCLSSLQAVKPTLS